MKKISNKLVILGYIFLTIFIVSGLIFIKKISYYSDGALAPSIQEMEAFNSKFTDFEGIYVPGAKVNQLIQTVIASNQQATDDDTDYYVEIEGFGICADGGDLLITKENNYRLPTSRKVLSTGVFTVKLEYYELQHNEQRLC